MCRCQNENQTLGNLAVPGYLPPWYSGGDVYQIGNGSDGSELFDPGFVGDQNDMTTVPASIAAAPGQTLTAAPAPAANSGQLIAGIDNSVLVLVAAGIGAVLLLK